LQHIHVGSGLEFDIQNPARAQSVRRNKFGHGITTPIRFSRKGQSAGVQPAVKQKVGREARYPPLKEAGGRALDQVTSGLIVNAHASLLPRTAAHRVTTSVATTA